MQAIVQPVGQLQAAVTCTAAIVPTCVLPPVITDSECKVNKRYISGTKISSKGRVKQRSHVADDGGEDYPWLGWFDSGFIGGPPWDGGGWGGAGGGGGEGGAPRDDEFGGRGRSPWSVGAWHAVCLASLANTAVFATGRVREDCCC